MITYLVMTNGTVLAAYVHRQHAETHQRTITGARIQVIDVLDRLADTANDDINVDEWDEEETPVEIPSEDLMQTRPSTPRAKAKSKPPTDG